MTPGLRPPTPLWERIKLPLILVAYVVASEWASPFPFRISFAARLAVLGLALLVLREFHHGRLEVDAEWGRKTRAVEERVRQRGARISRQSWLKIQRAVTWALSLYLFGMMLNTLTTRCSSPVQCTVLAPRLAVENLPKFLQFAIMVSLTLFQLAIMFYAMVKVGSFKLVLPGTMRVTFEDIWGQDAAVRKVREQVALLEDSEKVEQAGGFMPKGVLLWGPPGTGKTMLAKAAANYSTKPLILVPPGAFQATFIGVDLLKVWTLFRTIRKLARRYGGCVAPETLILTADLRWVRADSLNVGDEIMGVDEYGKREHGRRRTRIGTVEAVRYVKKQRYRVTTDRGDILVDGEHPFLARDYPVGTPKRHGGLSWRPTTELREGDSVRWFGEPWECEDGDSWLAGLLDGEGCVVYGSGHGRALTVTVNQNANGIHNRIRAELKMRGFSPREYVTPAGLRRNRKQFHTFDIGGARAAFRLLGQVRPQRLLDNLRNYYDESEWSPALPNDSWAHVLSVALEDVGDIVVIQTSSRTYIADGMVSHNCIVFFDEIDSLGSRGGNVDGGDQHGYLDRLRYMRAFVSGSAIVRARPAPTGCSLGCVQFGSRAAPGEERQMVIGNYQAGALQAFLSSMDGMEEPRGMLNRILVFLGFKPLRPYEYKYLMMGATNRIGALDEALLRAGRFGRKIHVTFPKVEGRRKTYEGYLNQVTNDLSPENVEWAARNHARGTGAEIESIVNEALLISFRDPDRPEPGVIRFDDLVRAMLWTRYGESEGPFEREQARWQVAVHEAGHAVAFHLLSRHRQRIWFASIERRGETGGMVAPTPLNEDWMLTRDELLADIQVSLASRVAEQLVLGTTTNGHGGDGLSATRDAERMVGYGQATQIGVYDADARDVRRQTEAVLNEALDACRELLTPRRDDIEAVARLLVEKGTCTGDEIHELLERAA